MELDLKNLAKQLQLAPKDIEKMALFQTRKEVFLEKRESFQESNDEMTKQFDEQIIKQINQYVKNYGERNGYKFIYGSDGSGNIMYADSTLDLSNDIIKYINAEYKGKVKK
jgi:outer membrane protein